jgi:hypothetical protein
MTCPSWAKWILVFGNISETLWNIITYGWCIWCHRAKGTRILDWKSAVFVSGLHTQEKAEDKSETLVCTPVMWVLFAAVNMLLTLEDCLYACLSPTMIKCCCHVSNRSIHHREEDQDFTVDVVTEGWRHQKSIVTSPLKESRSLANQKLRFPVSVVPLFLYQLSHSLGCNIKLLLAIQCYRGTYYKFIVEVSQHHCCTWRLATATVLGSMNSYVPFSVAMSIGWWPAILSLVVCCDVRNRCLCYQGNSGGPVCATGMSGLFNG